MRGDLSLPRKPICISKCINIMVPIIHLQVEHHYFQNNIKLTVFRIRIKVMYFIRHIPTAALRRQYCHFTV